MRKFLVYLTAIVLLVGGLILVSWPVPQWRLYDKNWQPLAMTQAENFCAGQLFGVSGVGDERDPAGMKACLSDSLLDNKTPSITNSLAWGCQGIASVADFPVDTCLEQVEMYNVWFLLNGGYTTEWNETGGNQRPVVADTNIQQAPPRGERSEEESGRF